MTESEMLQRINDLELALRLVILMWIVTVALLAPLIPSDDKPSDPSPRCALCLRKHRPEDPHR